MASFITSLVQSVGSTLKVVYQSLVRHWLSVSRSSVGADRSVLALVYDSITSRLRVVYVSLSCFLRSCLGVVPKFAAALVLLLCMGTGSVWGTTTTSITSYTDGEYYIIDAFTNQSSVVKYYALNSFINTRSSNITGVDVTSYVTLNGDGTITLDISTIEPKKYTLSHSNSTYYIQTYDGSPATLKYIRQQAGGNNLVQTGNDWSLVTNAESYSGRFRFASSYTKTKNGTTTTTNTCLMLQGTTWDSGTNSHVVSGVFKGYAQDKALATPNKEPWYGAGYLYLVPVPPSCTQLGTINGPVNMSRRVC